MPAKSTPTPHKNRPTFGERRWLDIHTRRGTSTLDLRPFGDTQLVKPSEYIIDLSVDAEHFGYQDSL